MSILKEYIEQLTHEVDRSLNRWVPDETTPPENLHKAMRYSLFAGGKRVRQILCISAAHAVRHEVPGL